MAFFSKVSNVLKQTLNRHTNSEICGSGPSIFQIIRSMSSSRLFVGGISYSADNQGLQEVFSNYGHVVEARILVDRETGRSRGFGFVTFSSSEEASAAIQALDGTELYGRTIGVKYAHDRPPRSGGYGGGYYDSNYNGGGGRGYPDGSYRSDGFRRDDDGAGGDLAGGAGGGANNYGNFGGVEGDDGNLGGNFGHGGGYPSETSQNTDMGNGNYVDGSQSYAGGAATRGFGQG